MTVLNISQDTLIQLPDGANGGAVTVTYHGTTTGPVIGAGDDQGRAVIVSGRLAKLTGLDGKTALQVVGREAGGRMPARVTLRIYPEYPAGKSGPVAPITVSGLPVGAPDAPGIWDLSNIDDSSGGLDVVTAGERQGLAVLRERTANAAAKAESGAAQIGQGLADLEQDRQTVISSAAAATLAQRTATDQAIDSLAAANANPADPTLLASRVRVGHVAAAARGTGGLQLGYCLPFWNHRTTPQGGQPDRDGLLTLLLDSGARLVRTDLIWADIEAAEGQYTWDETDWLFQTADLYGLHIIGIVKEAPAWARASGAEYPADGTKLARVAGLIAQRASSYRNMRLTLEIWNEPDLPNPSSGPATYWSPAQFAAACVAAHDASRPAGVEVVTGGLYAYTAPYFSAMYDAAPRLTELAGLGIHLYVQDQMGPEFRTTKESGYNRLEDLRALMDSRGHQQGSIWLTETGWAGQFGGTSAKKNTEAQVARNARAAVRWLRQRPELNVRAAVWYQLALDTAGTGAGTPEDHYGTHRPDGRPKPHFLVLQNLASPRAETITERPDRIQIDTVLSRAAFYLQNTGAAAVGGGIDHDSTPDRYAPRQGRVVLDRTVMTADSVWSGLKNAGFSASSFAMAGITYPTRTIDNTVGGELVRLIVDGYSHTYGLQLDGGNVKVNVDNTLTTATYYGVQAAPGEPLLWALAVQDGWATLWLQTRGTGRVRFQFPERLFLAYAANLPLLHVLVLSPTPNLVSGPLALFASLNDAEVDALFEQSWPAYVQPARSSVILLGAIGLPARTPDVGAYEVQLSGTYVDGQTREFVAPATGAYRFDWALRLPDAGDPGGMPPGTQVGHGIDNIGELWFGYAPTSNRTRLIGSRTRLLTKGDRLKLRVHTPGEGVTITACEVIVTPPG